jgi:hypothetical protein
MNGTKWLLPYRLKIWGWILSLPAFCAGLFYLLTGMEADWLSGRVPALIDDKPGSFFEGGGAVFFTMVENDLTDELIGGILMLGLILLCFTRQKTEDEYIAKIRLESFLWAGFIQCSLFLIALVTIYGIPFWYFMIVNLYLLPIVFVVRFYIKVNALTRAV